MDGPRGSVDLHLPYSTIFRALFTVLAVWCLVKLWPEIVFLLLALLLAVGLEPTVERVEARGVPRNVAVLLLALALLGAAAAFVALGLPPLVRQVVALVSELPLIRERTLARLPHHSPLGDVIEQLLRADMSPHMSDTVMLGKTTLVGLTTTAFVVITTLYLLVDGKRLYAWLLAYVPRKQRARVAETIPEVTRVVTAYVRGQLLISSSFGVFTAVLLELCDVPAVLPLAILAAACDVIPVIGIIIALIPAVLLALTVSPVTAGIVFVAYMVYHQIEAYIIVPRVYGSTLRLSTLAVLLALLVGGTLQGIIGVVLILPIVAAYPIIERIWLKDYLAPEVLRDHKALEHAAETGNDEAVHAVLQGEKHPDERRSRHSIEPSSE